MITIKTIEIEPYTVDIEYDEFPYNPRTEFEHVGTILYTSTRYALGDKQVDSHYIQEIVGDADNICLPVYAYIHSSIELSTSMFSDPWDSGQCGIIYVSKDKLKAEGIEIERAKTVLQAEIKVFAAYLAGEVYSYSIKLNDDYVGGCSGFYELDYCESQAVAECKAYAVSEIDAQKAYLNGL